MSVGFVVDDRGHGPRWQSWAVVVGLGGGEGGLARNARPFGYYLFENRVSFFWLFLISLSCVYVLLEKVDPILPPILPPIFLESCKTYFYPIKNLFLIIYWFQDL